MLKLPLDLLNHRHIQGRKDPSRTFTIVEGIVVLPNGSKAYCEFFINDRKAFQPGPYVVEMEVRVDQNRRLVAQVTQCYPNTAAKAAA